MVKGVGGSDPTGGYPSSGSSPAAQAKDDLNSIAQLMDDMAKNPNNAEADWSKIQSEMQDLQNLVKNNRGSFTPAQLKIINTDTAWLNNFGPDMAAVLSNPNDSNYQLVQSEMDDFASTMQNQLYRSWH